MLYKRFMFCLLLIFYSCAPSKQFVDLNKPIRITALNEELKNKNAEIRPFEGKPVKSAFAQITYDSLFYSHSDSVKSIGIDKVRSILVSPKLSTSTVIALSLFGLGTYSVLTADSREGSGAIYQGIGYLTFGSVVFVFGNNIEKEIYYLHSTDSLPDGR